MEDKTRVLGEKPVGKLLVEFSIPAIVGTVANSLYTIIDRLFVGNVVGADAIAGMSLTMPISFVIMAFGMLIGVGSGSLISIRLGENKKEEAEKILGNAFMLSLIISVVVSGIFLLTLNPLLTHFGASPKTLPYARQFISIILYGSLFQYLSFGLSAVIRAEGNPRVAMGVMLINAGINIVLDFIFIYLLGFGLRGTAVATVISQAVSATWVLLYFRGKTSVLKLRGRNMALQMNILKGIFAIGMAPFFMQLIASVVNILYNRGLAQYGGDAAIGAFGIINTITMFILMPIFGINQGAQPIIGYNYGALEFGRVKKTLKLAIIAATGIVTFGFVLTEVFPAQVLGAFTSDEELIDIGIDGMRIFLLALPIVGLQIVSANFFQAIGKAFKALMLSMLRQVIVLIPTLIIMPHFFGLEGVWIASPISDVVASLITVLVLLPEMRILGQKEQEMLRKPRPE
ncbi:MAG TPA: MATE family efflux transporter [Syntrophomonas sp.]|jgi:putative MATE family efflux protein|nr:MATE family efflux transporter [Syntrophomonas sp.]